MVGQTVLLLLNWYLHLTSYLYYQYYYRYRSTRKDVVKPLVDSSNFVTAKTRLENSIQEQNNFYPDMDTKKDFNYGEKIMMQHALNHLNAAINKDDPPYIDTATGTIKHQSDIVKEALLQTPKNNYSDT